MNLNVLFENAVSKFRDRVAFQDATRSVSFAGIDRRTRSLGSSLLALGLEKGSRIASLQYNSIETFEVDATAARFGFVRTLLNARYGLDDFEHALGHSGACALVFDAAFTETVDKLRARRPTRSTRPTGTASTTPPAAPGGPRASC